MHYSVFSENFQLEISSFSLFWRFRLFSPFSLNEFLLNDFELYIAADSEWFRNGGRCSCRLIGSLIKIQIIISFFFPVTPKIWIYGREQIMKYKPLQSEKSRLRKEMIKQMRKEKKAYKLLQIDIYYYCWLETISNDKIIILPRRVSAFSH